MLTLKFLNNDEAVQKICRDYWEVNEFGNFVYSVSELSNIYEMTKPLIYTLVKESCIAYVENICCSLCNKVCVCQNRTEFNKIIKKQHSEVCKDCLIKRKQQKAYEKAEAEKEAMLKEEVRRKQIYEKLIENVEYRLSNPFNISSATAKQLILLLAFMRFACDEELKYFQAHYEINNIPFTPLYDYDMSVIYELYQNKIISISPESNLSFINLNEDETCKFYLNKVQWILNSHSSILDIQSKIENIVYSPEFLERCKNEIQELCEEISLQECISYLYHQLKQRNFEFSVGEKTKSVLCNLLKKYSVSQVYNFIYQACRGVSDDYQKGGIPKKQVVNRIPGKMQRYSERVETEGWKINAYRRDFNLPQSELSTVLYNGILGVPDGGFNKTIEELFEFEY